MAQYGKKGKPEAQGDPNPFLFNIKVEQRELIELAAQNTGGGN
ncbi:MAG: hypothetical protein V3U74_05625 [Thermodesulfobacteriota bacterium]